MSLALFIRRSALVAVVLSLSAFVVTTGPAAAKPQPFPNPGQPQFPPKPVFNPNPPKPVFIPVKPIVLPILPKPVVNPPQPGPIVKPIDICVIMPSKCVKPVVVNPPPVIVAPPPIVVEETAHVIARPERATVEAPAASASCNCLTKQYQSDGSVIFRDVCTHDAAMATAADLQAQAQAAAQAQTQTQTQIAPAHQ